MFLSGPGSLFYPCPETAAACLPAPGALLGARSEAPNGLTAPRPPSAWQETGDLRPFPTEHVPAAQVLPGIAGCSHGCAHCSENAQHPAIRKNPLTSASPSGGNAGALKLSVPPDAFRPGKAAYRRRSPERDGPPGGSFPEKSSFSQGAGPVSHTRGTFSGIGNIQEHFPGSGPRFLPDNVPGCS